MIDVSAVIGRCVNHIGSGGFALKTIVHHQVWSLTQLKFIKGDRALVSTHSEVLHLPVEKDMRVIVNRKKITWSFLTIPFGYVVIASSVNAIK